MRGGSCQASGTDIRISSPCRHCKDVGTRATEISPPSDIWNSALSWNFRLLLSRLQNRKAMNCLMYICTWSSRGAQCISANVQSRQDAAPLVHDPLIAIATMTSVVLQDTAVESGVIAKTVVVPKAGGNIKAASKVYKVVVCEQPLPALSRVEIWHGHRQYPGGMDCVW